MSTFFNKLKRIFSFGRFPKTEKQIDFAEIQESVQQPWWGTFNVAEEQSHYAKIGNLVLCMDHFQQAWHIVEYEGEGEAQKKRAAKTFTLYSKNDEITLYPILPDRAILTPLEHALVLSPKSEKLLYLRTPIWARIQIGHPPLLLEEVSIEQFSDTWDGNHLDGELCFAANEKALILLEEISFDNYHVITPVVVTNTGSESVLIKNLKLPSPFLSIFSDTKNRLWSEELIINFAEDQPETSVIKGPPQGLKDTKILSLPRFSVKTGLKGWFDPLGR